MLAMRVECVQCLLLTGVQCEHLLCLPSQLGKLPHLFSDCELSQYHHFDQLQEAHRSDTFFCPDLKSHLTLMGMPTSRLKDRKKVLTSAVGDGRW